MKNLKEQLRNLPSPPLGPSGSHFTKRAFSDRAAQVAYSWVPTPVGTLLAVVTHIGLLTLAFESEDHDQVLEKVSVKVSPAVVETATAVEFVRQGLEAYFGQQVLRCDLPLDKSLITPFQNRVLDAAYAIPPGEVRTYGQVAVEAGNARAARATGRALGANPLPIVLPCHRVVASDGTLHGYAGGLPVKQWLLEHEQAGGALSQVV